MAREGLSLPSGTLLIGIPAQSKTKAERRATVSSILAYDMSSQTVGCGSYCNYVHLLFVY